jgi:hypothetical protein
VLERFDVIDQQGLERIVRTLLATLR